MSFDALTQLAKGAGIRSEIAWMWPVVVDGSMVVATAAALVLRSSPDRAVRLYPWAQLGLFALVSVIGNGLHALGAHGTVTLPGPVAVAVSGVPPVALLLSTHLLVMMLPRWRWSTDQAMAQTDREPVGQTSELVHEPVTQELSTGPAVSRDVDRPSEPVHAEVTREPEPVTPDGDLGVHEDQASEPISEPVRRSGGPGQAHDEETAALAEWIEAQEDQGETVSGQVVAERLGVSLSTGKRRLKAARRVIENEEAA
jgi:hypothetical protein